MTISLFALLVIIGAHFIGDFVLQWDAVAMAKSSSNLALTQHIAVYVMSLIVILPLAINWRAALLLAFTNGACHWITDWFTSRWTKKLWAAQRRHDFFVVIGLDQFIHLATFFISCAMLVRK